MQTIWGFGSLIITSNNIEYTVQFPNAIHTIYFKKQNFRQQAISSRLHQTIPRYRPIIECQISICDNTDIDKLLTLITIINYSGHGDGTTFAVNTPIYVTPRFNQTNTANYTYPCFIDSDSIVFEDLSSAQVGQTISLAFIGIDCITDLPLNISNPNTYIMIDQSSNTYIDQSSNTYIMIN